MPSIGSLTSDAAARGTKRKTLMDPEWPVQKIGKLSVPAYVSKLFRENKQLAATAHIIRTGTVCDDMTMFARLIKEFATNRDAVTGAVVARGKNYYGKIIEHYRLGAEGKAAATASSSGDVTTASGSTLSKAAVAAMCQYKVGHYDALVSWVMSTDNPSRAEMVGIIKVIADLKPSITKKEDIVMGIQLVSWVAARRELALTASVDKIGQKKLSNFLRGLPYKRWKCPLRKDYILVKC